MVALLGVAWGFGIAVSPPEVRLEAAPGSVVGQVLTVENTSGAPLEARVSLGDWWYGPDGHAFLPAGSHDRGLATVSRVTPEAFVLQHGERREVQVDIRVPPDATGGRYEVVFVEVDGEVSGVTATLRMTSLVMVDTGGVPAPLLVASPPEVDVSGGVATVRVPVSLDGEVHAFATLKGVFRSDEGGRMIREESRELRLLPGQNRTLSVRSASELEPGIHRFDGVITAEGCAPVRVSTRLTVP